MSMGLPRRDCGEAFVSVGNVRRHDPLYRLCISGTSRGEKLYADACAGVAYFQLKELGIR